MLNPLPRSDPDDFEETKTSCPACRRSFIERCHACAGSGKAELTQVDPKVYRFVLCETCDGEGSIGPCRLCLGTGMVAVSRASGFRRRA